MTTTNLSDVILGGGGGEEYVTEVATVGASRAHLFKVGDPVFLGDGRLVPWDVNMPEYKVRTTATANKGPDSLPIVFEALDAYAGVQDAVGTLYSRALIDSGVFTIVCTPLASGTGDVGLHVHTRTIDKTTLVVTANRATGHGNSVTISDFQCIYLGFDVTYEYFYAGWTRTSDNYGSHVLYRVERSTNLVTTSSMILHAVDSRNTRIVSVDKVSSTISFVAQAGSYKLTYDFVAMTLTTPTVLSNTVDFTDKGYPRDPSTVYPFYHPDDDCMYVFAFENISAENVYSTEASVQYPQSLWKVTTDGSTFTSTLLNQSTTATKVVHYCNTHVGGNTFVSRDKTNSPTGTMLTITPDGGVASLYDVFDGRKNLQQGYSGRNGLYSSNINSASFFSRYPIHFGTQGGLAFYQGEAVDINTGEVGPGLDPVLIYSGMYRALEYGRATTLFTDYTYIMLDEDDDWWYGLCTAGRVSINSSVYQRGFKYRKGARILSDGPIGYVKSLPSADGSFDIQRRISTAAVTTPDVQEYGGVYYPSVRLKGTFDSRFMNITDMYQEVHFTNGETAPDSEDTESIHFKGPIMMLYINSTESQYIQARGRTLVFFPWSNTGTVYTAEVDVGVI